MIKKLSKYFSILLILVLINSNFSFAFTQIMCKMSKVQNTCECKQSSCPKEVQIKSEESDCCKVKFIEINNTNTLEINKLCIISNVAYQTQNYFLLSDINSELIHLYRFRTDHFKPPADLPILFSHILI